MIYLLDVSALLALLLRKHQNHDRMRAWHDGKELALCPIVELGFLRISVLVYKARMDEARTILADFKQRKQTRFVPDSISALAGNPAPDAKKSTDWYLANLAQAHGMKWATLDTHADHPAAEVI